MRRVGVAGRLLWGLVCLTALSFGSGPRLSRAESRSKSGQARAQAQAEAALAQAQTAIEAKDYAGAYRGLSQAYQSQPNFWLLQGLAAVAAAEGKTVESQDLLRRFLADPGLDSKAPERATAQQRLQTLPLVAAGEVSVGAPRGALVEVDGRLVGVTPLPTALLVSSGRHRVAASSGKWRAETEVNVRTARLSELRFKEGVEVVVATLPAAVLYVDSYLGMSTPTAAPPPSEVEPKPAGEGGEAAKPATANAEPSAAPTVANPLLDPLPDALTQAAAAALKRENYVILGRGLALAYAQDEGACQGGDSHSDACLKALASRYGVDHAIRASVVRDERNVRIDVTLLDMQVEDVAATASANCPGCLNEQTAVKLADSITQVLTTGSGRARGTLSVTSEPAGSEVRIGSRRLGVTPVTRKVWAGSYQVDVTHEGHKPYSQQVDVKNDETTPLSATLVRLEPQGVDPAIEIEAKRQAQARARRRLIFIGAGAAGIAAGAVLLGFGASALAANGSCAVPNPADPMQCRRLFDTVAPGSALTAVGGALLIGGTVTLIWPFVKKD